MSETNQGTATVPADPTAPLRQSEAAAEMVRWLDRIRTQTPTVPAMSLPAAMALIKRAIERGRLPAAGRGDECRIGRAEMTTWFLAWMSANVFTLEPGR
jgi:hypothetical protein